MSQSTERSIVKKLFDHYDQLGMIRDRLAKNESLAIGETRKLQRQSRQRIDAIGQELRELPERNALGSVHRRYRLNKYQFVILLALLRRRLTSENPYLKGRELLQLLFDTSFEMLRGCAFLEPTGTLQSAGLIVPDLRARDEEDDLLETPFKVSDRVYRLVRNSFVDHSPMKLPASRTKPQVYRSNLSYLMDVRRLSLLYRKRASKVFQFDYWDDVGLGTAESVSTLSQQMEVFRNRITESLEKSARSDEFPLFTMRAEYGLAEEELIVLVTLLFQELTEGSAFLDAVDLLKLVSTSEEDLLRRRRLFGKRSPLIRHNLVALEEMVGDKELTAEAYLPNWVIDRMIGSDERSAIDADSRLDFHDYLRTLDSSETFFEDLDSSG
jgi:hypothetical protein